jgi:hypothetical protein
MSLLLLAAFLGALASLLFLGLRASYRSVSTCLIGAGLLLWASIVLSGQILSPFKALNSTAGFILLATAGAGLIALALRRWPAATPVEGPSFAWTLPVPITRLVFLFLLGTASLAALANIFLAVGFLPSNPDSLVYRFPRIYWYLGQGSLMHFTNATEPRPLYYPFNGTLLYLPLVKFQLGPRAFTLPSLVAWFAVGLTTYAFARSLGGPRIAAAATAWLVCLTPNTLIQAVSTNDEVIAAWPLLAGLFFLHRWHLSGCKLDALIGVLGIAISAGTKLHIMFYWPLLLLIGAVSLWRWRSTWALLRSWISPAGGAVIMLMLAIVFVFTLSFILYNLVSAGRATAWEFSEQILNKPFNVYAALQTTGLFLAQMILTPVADLMLLDNWENRAPPYAKFNQSVAPLFTWVNNGPAFTSAFYRFTGVNSSSADMYNEQTVFIGFTWVVAVIASLWLFLGRSKSVFLWGRFQLLSFPVWFVSFAASTKYIEGFTVYLSYALVVAGPALVYAFAPFSNRGLSLLRWALLAMVAIAHVALDRTGYYVSAGRNLLLLRQAAAWPLSTGFSVDDAILTETRVAKAGVVSYSIAWGQPYWPFMAFNPRIPQFMAYYPATSVAPAGAPADAISEQLNFSRYVLSPKAGDRRLHVFTFPQFPMWGRAIPVRIADRTTSGLTLIGSLGFALGPEWVFAAGNGVAGRFPGRDKYIVQRFEELSNFGHTADPAIALSSVIYGLEHGDAFSFRHELQIDGAVVASTEWSRTPKQEFKASGLGQNNGVLTFYVRNDATGRVYSTALPLRSTKPLQLN